MTNRNKLAQTTNHRGKLKSGIKLAFAAAVLMPLAMLTTAQAGEYELRIENHQFVPSQLEVTAGEKHRLTVHNMDATAEEFESYELNREKVIAGNTKAIIFLPPLEAGSYPFFGEFNAATAQGRIVAK